jgi:hypothetical protein
MVGLQGRGRSCCNTSREWNEEFVGYFGLASARSLERNHLVSDLGRNCTVTLFDRCGIESNISFLNFPGLLTALAVVAVVVMSSRSFVHRPRLVGIRLSSQAGLGQERSFLLNSIPPPPPPLPQPQPNILSFQTPSPLSSANSQTISKQRTPIPHLLQVHFAIPPPHLFFTPPLIPLINLPIQKLQ